jgi:hypothetical protein
MCLFFGRWIFSTSADILIYRMNMLKKIIIEPISKCSIGLKIKAGWGGQPQAYTGYFEDWPPRPNTDIEFEGTF